jgi:type IV fimbrial biogenesis protein FimT
MSKYPFNNKGLTMIELMITLAITGILLVSAAPSFRTSIQNNRMVTQVNELQALLSLARSEAVKRNESIRVCGGTSVDGCTDAWQNGWLVFVDLNSDDKASDNEILRVHGSLSGGNVLTFTGSETNVIYAANGIATSGVGGTFTLCDARGTDKAKGLVIGLSGRPRLAIESDSLECPS